MKSLKIDNFQTPVNLPSKEHDVLEFWDEDQTFKKSVDERPDNKPYIFYDGPPFATGTPHYGHILASTIKDVIPRYWTMKGYKVERVWGWDCHGIPIENMIEKELDLKGGKKGIEAYGVANFNDACRAAILRFDKEWERVIHRMGRWVDFKNSYKTMDTTFMESVWWAFKQLDEKDLVYQGRRVILYCPRCATSLSNFEIAMDNSYKDLEGPSTTYKYKVKNQENTYLLAWSTTPWNKIATPALAVNPDLTYVKVKEAEEYYILAKTTLAMLKGKAHEIVEEYKGSDLDGMEFELHFDFFPNREGKKAGIVVADSYVTADEGTGIVTLAIYGEDDYRVMLDRDIQLVEHVDEQGMLKAEVTPWAGMFMLKVNPLVNEDLAARGLIYHDEQRVHSVPVCYRCETRLYHAPVPAWFINVAKLKGDLTAQNENINWYPGYLKHGRFGKGIESAPDWNISRSRFWGTPMPIWIGDKTGKIRIIGSIDELKTWAVNPEEVKDLTDIHRHHIDHIKVWVDDDKKEAGTRIPDVFDCWVESGSMPYASIHYPFENKQKFEDSFPAQFISEYIAQTRAWFYTLHVMSVGIFGKPTFENALTTGTILAEDGAKMSKSKKNYPDPEPLFEKYGVDALRFYLMNSVVMKAGNLNFSEQGVKEIYQKTINIIWNTFTFYKLYSDESAVDVLPKLTNTMDKWVISRLNGTISSVTRSLDTYDTVSATRHISEFIADLSTWYLRRSRDRLRDDKEALIVFGHVISQTVKLMAPFTPFVSELIYQNLNKDGQSVHLSSWPVANTDDRNELLEEQMKTVRTVVEKIHALRQQHGIKVRQPLASAQVTLNSQVPIENDPGLIEILTDEVNVKKITWKTDKQSQDIDVLIDINVTKALEEEGLAREIVRSVQQKRKEAGVAISQKISLTLPDWPTAFEDYIKQKTLSETITKGSELKVEAL